MKNKTDLFLGLAILIFCAVMGQQISIIQDTASDRLFNPYTMPKWINITLSILASIMVIKSFFGEKNEKAWMPRAIVFRVASFSLLVILYILAFIYIGEWAYNMYMPMGTAFAFTTFLFLSFAQFICGYRKFIQIVGISTVYTAVCYVVFGYLFNVPLP